MSSLNKMTVEDVEVAGKKVLVRCDFNIPIVDGKITDDKRIVESLKTIKYLLDKHAKVILCSHFGRPKGNFNNNFSLKPVAEHLEKLLDLPVKMAKDVIGESAISLVNSLKNSEVMLLENVRFHKEEEKNDREFSKKLASLAEIYVNDAFGTAHRAHSSTTGVAEFLPAVCGYLIQKEIDMLSKAIDTPKRPLIAILGGAKVSDKIGVILSLLDKVDILIVGGGMAYTFAKALGHSIGVSICEEDKLNVALDILKKAEEKGVKLLKPVDNVIADNFKNDANFKTVDTTDIPNNFMGMDIGHKTIELFSNEIRNAKGGTVIWNGPMGVFEFENFSKGTKALAQVIADTDIISIIGGGDSAAAVEQMGLAGRMSHISTGGGASLELLEGVKLPGIEALNDK